VKTYESLKKLQSEIAVWEDELTHKNSTLGSLQKTELKNRNWACNEIFPFFSSVKICGRQCFGSGLDLWIQEGENDPQK
jgi:hypothetical protein